MSVGCAGWSVASGERDRFGEGSSVLQRYTTRFDVAEINSSFYRSHRHSTYRRWADSVPTHFQFSVKLPKTITHVARLHGCQDLLSTFIEEVSGLQHTLGCLLVQLPPSLHFDVDTAHSFFQTLRTLTAVPTVCEPRHPSWFTPDADTLLRAFKTGRVAADPAMVPAAAVPGGDQGTVYFRWHGSPQLYTSSYSEVELQTLASALMHKQHAERHRWAIFDNTAAGAAVDNALTLKRLLAQDTCR
ncbi:DUF72 domain-containing protein (plasmid) [Deinococcus sp. KNUC1210]|uniref:DUF72 domain-containing protein n=1 Tax=Deinococcus sp. KNUC1210 TaxID=2917691 RepID=UPI001EF06C00|nr:DUF72 domain-containing protein [Deinococcus sp. KNUC1210]ULH18196.1 DUF72 domain-containing protein [Deinococcus sp. KNUC1210]